MQQRRRRGKHVLVHPTCGKSGDYWTWPAAPVSFQGIPDFQTLSVRVSSKARRIQAWAAYPSAATLGERKGTVGNEESPHRGSFLSDYERSKFKAERAVLAAAEETGIEVVCVNPASVQGPGRATGSTKLLLDYLNGRLKAVVDSTLSLIDIADCTTGHLLAASKGKPGERYVLSGATLTVREGLALLGSLAGVEQPVRTLRPSLAMALATAVEAVAWLRRGSPRICRELARTITHGHAYDGSKAARELGLRYTPIEETLRRTIDWWVEQGLVPAREPANSQPTS